MGAAAGTGFQEAFKESIQKDIIIVYSFTPPGHAAQPRGEAPESRGDRQPEGVLPGHGRGRVRVPHGERQLALKVHMHVLYKESLALCSAVAQTAVNQRVSTRLSIHAPLACSRAPLLSRAGSTRRRQPAVSVSLRTAGGQISFQSQADKLQNALSRCSVDPRATDVSRLMAQLDVQVQIVPCVLPAHNPTAGVIQRQCFHPPLLSALAQYQPCGLPRKITAHTGPARHAGDAVL